MKRLLAVLCLTLSSCVTVPSSVKLNSDSKQGLILIEVEPESTTFAGPDEGVSKSLSLGYFLTFSRYPSSASTNTPPALGDWVHVEMLDLRKTSQFYAAEAPAGTYAFEAVNVGAGVSWGSCFNKATVAFDVRAGEVVFLGKLAPRPVFEDMGASLPSKLPIGTYRYVFDRTAPAFTSSELTESKNAEIAEFLRQTYPNVKAPVKAGALRPAAFRSGKPSALARFPRCASTE